MDGKPLMPTERHGKVRRLLRDGKAIVVRRSPFTIQLQYPTENKTQEVTLGVDAGSKTIGLSASTEQKEIYAAEVKPRNDVVKNLSTRREFRRSRRGRKRRYRKARFNNRVHSKHKGWLAPSVEVKIQEHITAIKRVCELLPISKIVVETAEFDLQLIKAVEDGLPVPVGEDYQKGEMRGFYNVRQYVLHRDNYTCQCCKKSHKTGDNLKLHVHHLESRKVGGDAPDNLVTLCEECHSKLHEGKILLPGGGKRKRRSTRDATFMGIMRKTLMRKLKEELPVPIVVVETMGYITKCVREEHGLVKDHVTDALCIAGHPTAVRADKIFLVKPVRHHNRQLHRATILKGGKRKSNQAPNYVNGFRLFDKVLYQRRECFIWARRITGSFLLRRLDGTKVKDGVSSKKLTLLERSTTYLTAEQ